MTSLRLRSCRWLRNRELVRVDVKSIRRVAFIDDRLDNRSAWQDAMQQICSDAAELQTFATISDFRHQLDRGYTPNVVFVDYFVGDEYGQESSTCCEVALADKWSSWHIVPWTRPTQAC